MLGNEATLIQLIDVVVGLLKLTRDESRPVTFIVQSSNDSVSSLLFCVSLDTCLPTAMKWQRAKKCRDTCKENPFANISVHHNTQTRCRRFTKGFSLKAGTRQIQKFWERDGQNLHFWKGKDVFFSVFLVECLSLVSI